MPLSNRIPRPAQSAPDSQPGTGDPAARRSRTRTPRVAWVVHTTWTNSRGEEHSQRSWPCSEDGARALLEVERMRCNRWLEEGIIKLFDCYAVGTMR